MKKGVERVEGPASRGQDNGSGLMRVGAGTVFIITCIVYVRRNSLMPVTDLKIPKKKKKSQSKVESYLVAGVQRILRKKSQKISTSVRSIIDPRLSFCAVQANVRALSAAVSYQERLWLRCCSRGGGSGGEGGGGGGRDVGGGGGGLWECGSSGGA